MRIENRVLKGVICLLGIFLIFQAANLHAGKVDLLLRALQNQQRYPEPIVDTINGREQISVPMPFSILENILDISVEKEELRVYAFIESDSAFDGFDELGVHVNSRVGGISTAYLSLDQIDMLAEQEGIIHISPSVKCELDLDTSLIAMGAQMAIDSFNLDGEGVIIGVIDVGFDVRNDDFSETNDTSKTRILYYFNVLNPSGPSPFNYGTEFAKWEIDFPLNQFPADQTSHGTHVMGIVCGNGQNTYRGVPAGTFKGVAPEANMICFDFRIQTAASTAKILDGACYIADKADSMGMPCVINISMSSPKGPRDGSSPFELGLSELKNNYANDLAKIIVTSAGNTRFEPNKEVSRGSRCHSIRYGTDTTTFFVGSDSSIGLTPEYVAIEIWYPGDEDFYVSLIAPNNAHTFGPYGPGVYGILCKRPVHVS